MTDMREKLHDEVDKIEEQRARAKERVEDVVRSALTDAVELTGDIGDALLVIAESVEDELAAITTEAFQMGRSFARARAK